jgi:hypothetical protein
MNVALFISGRLLGYNKCLIPLLNKFPKEYNIKVFFSINTLSLDKSEDILVIINDLKQLLGDRFGDIYYENYKLPYEWVSIKLQHQQDAFSYNQMSCFYNDKQNLRLIEDYQTKNNMTFDIISKIRSDMIIQSSIIYLKRDDPDTLLIRTSDTKLKFWGHLHDFSKITYHMISDAFAYGNIKSMRIYCRTHDWSLEQNKLLNGRYACTFEPLLTNSIINYRISDHDDGNNNPNITSDRLFDIFLNNTNNIKIVYESDIKYDLLPTSVRSKNNFTVNKTNVLNFTHPCPE